MKRALSLSVCLALLVSASPGAAKSAKGEAPYYQSGPWTVSENTGARSCKLEMHGVQTGAFEVLKADAEPAFFDYEPRQELDYYAPKTGVEWRFDDTVIEGELVIGKFFRIKDPDWRTRSQSAEAAKLFRSAERLVLSQNGEVMLDIDLTGSLKAYDQLARCAAQWPGAELLFAPVPPPPPRPSVRGPNLSAPLPANREVTPIRQDQWIRPSDYPTTWERPRSAEQRVGFRVIVNQQGRVESCAVTSSSGVRMTDERTCGLIKLRARFEPQTNEKAEAVRSQFSSVVVWKLPEPLKDAPEE